MTASFVLVSGGYTGGWLWRDVAAGLRAAGAEAHAVTLTGLGDRRHLAGPGVDLDTHIEDVTQLIDHIDSVDAPEVVLVGYCYGIYPAVGAADRRADRISRLVHLDSPMPQDGYSMIDQVREQMPDGPARDRTLAQQERAEDGWRIPAPSLEEWRAHGNLAGVPAEALARLARLASPAPAGPYAQKLRISEAVAALPTTGVFCTTGGTMDIASLEALVASGLPLVQHLADPRATFFDMATGHWPMLSVPDELVEVLLEAAAGRGHRLRSGVAAGGPVG
ncbi:alpha/beta fold hydrolase [Streptomyces sp. Je 1-369]|uniref:alpha/beta fold hydrolase n=1 Tax=Streptomyces sp. Je 1-369 TaxID=2966192 RepID=UPI002285E194|nr:alpha/beta fold hydrolase [Streptomyces sp. Je 1-369]WAL97947.1 alpha/beta fold hydrolase [Streptomyces sp. Je 1-369]